MSQEERNNRPSSKKKVKSSSGRKQGYKMASWQKEIQKAACREKDLEGFNAFMEALVDLLERFQGETFIIEGDSREFNLFCSPMDFLFVLQKVAKKRGYAGASSLIFFVNQSVPSIKLCLKVYDLYDMIKSERAMPFEEEVKEDFFLSLLEALRGIEGSFPDKELLTKVFLRSLGKT